MSDHHARRFTEEDRKMARAVQLTAAREAVIAAAKAWSCAMSVYVHGEAGQKLEQTLSDLRRLEATDATP